MKRTMKQRRASAQQNQKRRTDAEIADALRGTCGRVFVHEGGIWRDTETGETASSRFDLEQSWLAGLQAWPEA